MSATEQIVSRQAEMKKYISFLMNNLKNRLEAKKDPTKDSSDYKYDFILNLDDFPFFAMYVNMKKAIYEQCLLAAQENGELNENALDALEEGELLSEKGELLITSLKELTYKKGELTYEPDSILNYEKFEDYLDRLEKPLLYIEPYSGAIINIYDRLNFNIPNVIL